MSLWSRINLVCDFNTVRKSAFIEQILLVHSLLIYINLSLNAFFNFSTSNWNANNATDFPFCLANESVGFWCDLCYDQLYFPNCASHLWVLQSTCASDSSPVSSRPGLTGASRWVQGQRVFSQWGLDSCTEGKERTGSSTCRCCPRRSRADPASSARRRCVSSIFSFRTACPSQECWWRRKSRCGWVGRNGAAGRGIPGSRR